MLVHYPQEHILDPENIESSLEEQFTVHSGKEIKQLENWPASKLIAKKSGNINNIRNAVTFS